MYQPYVGLLYNCLRGLRLQISPKNDYKELRLCTCERKKALAVREFHSVIQNLWDAPVIRTADEVDGGQWQDPWFPSKVSGAGRIGRAHFNDRALFGTISNIGGRPSTVVNGSDNAGSLRDVPHIR